MSSKAGLTGGGRYLVPDVSDKLREDLAKALHSPVAALRRETTPASVRHVAPDLLQFKAQAAEFAERGLKQRVAYLKDEDGEETLPVLLAPDLMDFTRSLRELDEAVGRSGIAMGSVGEKAAQKILLDRMAEFLTVYGKPSGGGSGGKPTTVHSARNNDTILYCKGYFVSTATAFGISTPAKNVIPPGRYLFGVAAADEAGHKFDSVLWTCPTVARVNLP